MAHALLVLFSKTAVPLFFMGMVGSACVVIATVLRDLQEVVSSDETSSPDLEADPTEAR